MSPTRRGSSTKDRAAAETSSSSSGPSPSSPPAADPFSPPPVMPGLVTGSSDPSSSSPSDPSSPGQSSLGPDARDPSAGAGSTPSQGLGSSPRSTAKRRGVRKRELKELCGHAVTMVGGVLNSFLTAADTPERDGGLWIPDRDDVDQMSDPLAGLASRRAPEGVDNPDATDVARLVVAVIGYVGKQLRRRVELRGVPVSQRWQDPGVFDPSDPDRWAPTGDGDQGDDEERRKAEASAQARGFLSRRLGGNSAPTAPTTGTGGPEPTQTEDTAS